MTYTLTQLAAEINTDPKALGLAALKAQANAAGDEAIAAKLNATYAGVGVVYRTDVTPSELLACIVWSEVSAFTATQWSACTAMLSAGNVDASKVTIRNFFAGLFTAATTTKASMDTVARIVNPTRAEELWGHSMGVSAYDVQKAMGR